MFKVLSKIWTQWNKLIKLPNTVIICWSNRQNTKQKNVQRWNFRKCNLWPSYILSKSCPNFMKFSECVILTLLLNDFIFCTLKVIILGKIVNKCFLVKYSDFKSQARLNYKRYEPNLFNGFFLYSISYETVEFFL